MRQLQELTAPCPEGVDPSTDWSVIRCQRPYTFENTDAAYVADPAAAGDRTVLQLAEPVRAPTRSVIGLTDEQIDRVAASYVPIEQTQSLRLGNVVATLEAGQFLAPWQQFALNIINEVAGERPVYFASSGNAAASLGVRDYLVRQGLAFKMVDGPPAEVAGPGVVEMAQTPYVSVTGEWIDAPRTRALFDEVFVYRSGVPDDWSHWPDLATIGIPNYYAWGYLALTQAAVQANEPERIERYQARAEAWSELGS